VRGVVTADAGNCMRCALLNCKGENSNREFKAVARAGPPNAPQPEEGRAVGSRSRRLPDEPLSRYGGLRYVRRAVLSQPPYALAVLPNPSFVFGRKSGGIEQEP